ncbi:Protein of unknown function [Pseudomonas borbori]|uniref:Outer membrane lipoprotein-sorting protein n=1 Tax=Pseudomonas borbori TaxID=289003 RepID=A0A1I5WQ63_9PSED|nr:Protein of unknown function [Pseudomonas borbori]
MTHYKGGSLKRDMVQVSSCQNGNYSLVKFNDMFSYTETVEGLMHEHMQTVLFFYKQKVLSPSCLASGVLLAHETIDQVKDSRRVWLYIAGQRRVRRAPQVVYDGPGQAADGQRLADNLDLYNGSSDRYDWKLVGKKEVYIPYSSYKLASPELEYSDIFKVGHIDQDLTRYELHRVWEVVATLKPGQWHVYRERRFYVDEDTWQIAAQDMFDSRGNLWRVGHIMRFYDKQVPLYADETLYNLKNRRYLAVGFSNKEAHGPIFGENTSVNDYSPGSLRLEGVR